MKIIEKFISSKYINQNLCEDGMFIGKKVIAVIDGVTSKGKTKFAGCSSGKYATKIICNKLEKGISTESAFSFFTELNNALANSIKFDNKYSENDIPRASVIAYIPDKHEIWSYGDCKCIIGNQYHSHEKIIDVELSNKRAAIIQQAILNGKKETDLQKHDLGREAILEDLKQQSEYENIHCFKNDIDYGYPVLNGKTICEDMIITYKVPNFTDIVLATDGYPILKNSLKESEFELDRILCEDPLCYKIFKSTKGISAGAKSFDDRTYLKIKT